MGLAGRRAYPKGSGLALLGHFWALPVGLLEPYLGK
jgi:hypothetical protein